jgi:hypothetical protein
MQTITQIVKEIGVPVWICWGISALVIVMTLVSRRRGQGAESKSWLSILPIPGIAVLLLSMAMIFYFDNQSLERRKEYDHKTAAWQGQLAAMRSSPLIEEEKIITLDRRLQSVDGIIGYLDQSIKMGHEPKNLTPIILALAKEIKGIRDEN